MFLTMRPRLCVVFAREGRRQDVEAGVIAMELQNQLPKTDGCAARLASVVARSRFAAAALRTACRQVGRRSPTVRFELRPACVGHRLAVVRSSDCRYGVSEPAASPAQSWSGVRTTACARLWPVTVPPTGSDWVCEAPSAPRRLSHATNPLPSDRLAF